MGAISETGKRFTRLALEQRSSEEDLLWVSGLTDLKKDMSQGVLLVGLESNMKINCGLVGRGTQADPISRDDVPLVFCDHLVPRRRDLEGHCKTAEDEGDSNDREHRESAVAHNCKRPLEARQR